MLVCVCGEGKGRGVAGGGGGGDGYGKERDGTKDFPFSSSFKYFLVLIPFLFPLFLSRLLTLSFYLSPLIIPLSLLLLHSSFFFYLLGLFVLSSGGQACCKVLPRRGGRLQQHPLIAAVSSRAEQCNTAPSRSLCCFRW